MGTAIIPIELYKILEDKLGREQATEVVNLYEQTAEAIHTSVKIAVKEELKNELVTKEEFKAGLAEIRAEIRVIRIEMKFLIVLMIIAITLMNPVAAELIKGLLKL
ncbi:MAG: hypothetical protein A2X55_11420 [Nitrospirae bacterium GWB2_47_37]|nr:MAG: hypothetical protein A2X55_11420 [Nitrospirae bacterium GWB2_47_37]HAK87961.1 hypothetical protein [Nitrospiraceae bacterium]